MNTPKNVNISALIQNFDPKKEFIQPMLIVYLPLTFIFGIIILFLQRICRPVRKIKIGRMNISCLHNPKMIFQTRRQKPYSL